ncbi:hypothetical protein D3C80_1240520 [compost metagenome]
MSGNRSAVKALSRTLLLQIAGSLIQLLLCCRIGLLNFLVCISFIDMNISYQQYSLLDMIKNDHLITKHELYVLHIHIIHLMGRKLLVILKQIITKKSDGPACKRRHFR